MLNKIKTFIKYILSIKFIRVIYENLLYIILKISSSNRFLSVIYHFIFFFSFNREQFACLKGRAEFYKTLGLQEFTNHRLRRNIHRIEKGLVFNDRKEIFAASYIEETIEAFEDSINKFYQTKRDNSKNEIIWAQNVLDKYFLSIKSESIRKLKRKYDKIKENYGEYKNTNKKIPYKEAQRVKCNINFEEYLKLCKKRKSVRWFTDKKVPRDKIDKAIYAASFSPSACNRLPYTFLVFDDPKLVNEVANIPFGTKGYADQIPVIAVVVGNLDSFFSIRDRHLIYTDGALAAMSFIHALETLGIASCAINWPDFEPLERKLQNKLKLKIYQRPIMLIALGYPDSGSLVAYSERKDLSILRSYNLSCK